jgi:hypothetical protein
MQKEYVQQNVVYTDVTADGTYIYLPYGFERKYYAVKSFLIFRKFVDPLFITECGKLKIVFCSV